MKKSAKVALIVAVCLIVIGLLFGGVSLLLNSRRGGGWSVSFRNGLSGIVNGRESVEFVKRTESFSAAEVKSLELATVATDIKLVAGSSSQYRVTCYENEDRWYDIELDGGRLKIKEENKPGFSDTHISIFDGNEQYTVTVEVPAKCAAVSAATVSGDVYIPALTMDGGFSAATTSGDIFASDGVEVLGGVSVATTSGDVSFSGTIEGGFSCTKTSGDLSFSGEAESFSVKTTSGDLVLSGCAFSGKVDVTTVSGEIVADGFVCGPLKLKTTSGDISIRGLESGEIDIDTTSGDVALTMTDPDAYKYEIKSTSGDVRTPYGISSGVLCDVHTTSGDVVIG